MTKIAVLVGSLRSGSLNKKLAQNLEMLAPEGVVFDYVDLHIPLYDEDLVARFPQEVQRGKDIIRSADGILFVTPEYNRSVPGVLKNAIDWFSRPYGESAFEGKPAGIVGASTGQIGTAAAQAHLRGVVVNLNTKLMGKPEVYFSASGFDENGKVVEGSRDFLAAYMAAFTDWVRSEERIPATVS